MKYEIKKVFSGRGGKVALGLLVLLVAVVSFAAISEVHYVDAQGNSFSGPRAARLLRAEKSRWTGYLTEDIFNEVIRLNAEINASPEGQSDDWRENDKAYARKQGFSDIRDVINSALCSFREYDYYRIDRARASDGADIYALRIANLTDWLNSDEAKDRYSDAQRAFFTRQYENLTTPLYYEDADGWDALLTYSETVIMLTMLILSVLVCGLFSREYQLKADAIFFSTKTGRDRAVRAKILAGIVIVTAVYWVVVLMYTGIVLGVLGAGGGSCQIQASLHGWKTFYNITWFEEYLLTVLGGYVGTLFVLTLAMLVSAWTRSAVLAVMIPVVVLFLPVILSSIQSQSGVLGLFPDQLLQISYVVRYFNVYEIGGRVVAAIPVLFVLYAALFAGMVPLLYGVFRNAEIE